MEEGGALGEEWEDWALSKEGEALVGFLGFHQQAQQEAMWFLHR